MDRKSPHIFRSSVNTSEIIMNIFKFCGNPKSLLLTSLRVAGGRKSGVQTNQVDPNLYELLGGPGRPGPNWSETDL
jgi:hypothetical protein